MNIKNWFKPKDWQHMWTDSAWWDVTYTNMLTGCMITGGKQSCTFEIIYSPSRNEYKLFCLGTKPKTNPLYKIAIKKLNDLKNETNTTN